MACFWGPETISLLSSQFHCCKWNFKDKAFFFPGKLERESWEFQEGLPDILHHLPQVCQDGQTLRFINGLSLASWHKGMMCCPFQIRNPSIFYMLNSCSVMQWLMTDCRSLKFSYSLYCHLYCLVPPQNESVGGRKEARCWPLGFLVSLPLPTRWGRDLLCKENPLFALTVRWTKVQCVEKFRERIQKDP